MEHKEEIQDSQPDPKSQLKGQEAFHRFALAGRAIFTVRSKATGTRFTYRVRRWERGATVIWFVDYLGGGDNESDWRWIGTLRHGKFLHGFAHAAARSDAPVVIAFGWAWRHPDSGQLEVWHEGRCGRCGRRLTVPESIESGLGPECASKAA